MILSKCAICGSKKSRFIKNQEAKGLLSNLCLRTPLSKVTTLCDFLLWMYKKVNEIVNKFLLAGDRFMSEMHLKQPGFTYSACGPLTKTKERIQNSKKQDIKTVFKKMSLIRLAFNMTWLMEILKI